VNGTCSTCCGGTATATLLGKSLRLAVAGEGLAAAVRVDPQVLHFGRVPCHEWADQVVQVHNVSQRSVLVVVDKGSANFQVSGVGSVLHEVCGLWQRAWSCMCPAHCAVQHIRCRFCCIAAAAAAGPHQLCLDAWLLWDALHTSHSGVQASVRGRWLCAVL
jgi:hypothetical protein